MARIAIGGVQHETNTFAASRAGWSEFEAADAWPGFVRGRELLDAIEGINLPIAGFTSAARTAGHSLAPLSWCSAQPSGPVTQDAFEKIAALLLEDLAAAPAVDAVYLDLHGAMVAEHIDDADGELLARVRALVGPDTPIIASLDFHANVSDRMIRTASLLVGYRTYPHIDMAATGARAAQLIARLMNGPAPHKSIVRAPFLIPLTWQCTLIEPMASLVAQAQMLEDARVLSVSIAAGFPLADVEECGPSIYGYGETAAVEAAITQLSEAMTVRESEFAGRFWSVRDAVTHTSRARSARPIIWVDTQDNPGAGGNADTTTLLRELLANGPRPAAAGVFHDPDTAARAHAAGLDSTLEFAIGGKCGFPGEQPLIGRFRVAALGDGRFTGTGPFYHGARMALGPMACLEADGLSIVIASRKQQAADQSMFRHLGVEPAHQRVLLLKSSVHFRADFAGLAGEILIVRAPGPSPADPATLEFKRLRPGVRLAPACL